MIGGVEHYGGLIFFEDGPELLKTSIRAMKACGLKVIAIDGAFKEFLKMENRDVYESTDGCIDVAKSEADLFIPCKPGGWDDQAEKRNEYVKATPLHSYFWIIDADEIIRLFNDLKNPLTEDSYRIMESRYTKENVVTAMSTVRVYKKYPDLAYKYQHCRVYRMDKHNPQVGIDSGLVTKASSMFNFEKPLIMDSSNIRVTIDHRMYLRPLERNRIKQNYYRTREEMKMGYA
jgi:hypothetical protein